MVPDRTSSAVIAPVTRGPPFLKYVAFVYPLVSMVELVPPLTYLVYA